jgi:copper ion binding protein
MGCCSDKQEKQAGKMEEQVGEVTTQVRATGMSCQHCVMAIKKSVGGLPGVRDVAVDLATGVVTVKHAPSGPDRDAIRAAIREAGYEPQD